MFDQGKKDGADVRNYQARPRTQQKKETRIYFYERPHRFLQLEKKWVSEEVVQKEIKKNIRDYTYGDAAGIHDVKPKKEEKR